MSMQVIEDAIKAKDTKTLCDLMALITAGLREITTVAPSEEGLKTRVWGLAMAYIKRYGEEGRSKLFHDIVIPALGKPKTFTDCTDDDLKAIEVQLLKDSSHG